MGSQMRSLGATLRPRNAGGDHNGTPLRQERTGAGVRGGAPVRPLLRQRRDTPGVRNAAQPPVASANVDTLDWLAHGA